LGAAQKNYSTTEKECLAVVWATEIFRPYLYGTHFKVISDHSALQWLLQFRGDNQRLVRWSLKLAEYDFEVEYRKGSSQQHVDALSRVATVNNPDNDEDFIEVFSVVEESISKIRELQDRDSGLDQIRNLAGTLESRYFFWNGVLYRKWEKKGMKYNQLVVPHGMYHEAMREVHDERLTGAHLGLKKTLKKLQQRYWWPKYRRDVEYWIKSCEKCGQQKPHEQQHIGEMLNVPVGKPWDVIGMDILGPTEPTKNGNRYMLVFMDYFTKWPEVVALQSVTSLNVATALINEVICRHGVPKKVITDRGGNFMSDLMTQVFHKTGTVKLNTTSYHPQTDGLVERFNKTLTEMLSMYRDKFVLNWDEHLGYVLFG
jgi:hypothetical protein